MWLKGPASKQALAVRAPHSLINGAGTEIGTGLLGTAHNSR